VIAAITQADITCFGTMSGYDEDGDELTFEVSEYPSRGILKVNSYLLRQLHLYTLRGTCGCRQFYLPSQR